MIGAWALEERNDESPLREGTVTLLGSPAGSDLSSLPHRTVMRAAVNSV